MYEKARYIRVKIQNIPASVEQDGTEIENKLAVFKRAVMKCNIYESKKDKE